MNAGKTLISKKIEPINNGLFLLAVFSSDVFQYNQSSVHTFNYTSEFTPLGTAADGQISANIYRIQTPHPSSLDGRFLHIIYGFTSHFLDPIYLQ
jgi:hypothetical protein